MAQNRGKQFETHIKEAFLKVPEVSIDRMHDQLTGYRGSQNICDFIVYKKPYEYYIECKSVHGNTLPFSNITDTQWKGLLEKSKIPGVRAGVICWWIDKDVTAFIDILELQKCKEDGHKSIRYSHIPILENTFVDITGQKKKVFYDYDIITFFKEIENEF